jgi:hypothetical protein
MSWATRPWALRPNDHVTSATRGRRPGYRARLTLDPRAWPDVEDANDLRVEGTVMACTADGPTLIFEEPTPLGDRFALIDVLAVERVTA